MANGVQTVGTQVNVANAASLSLNLAVTAGDEIIVVASYWSNTGADIDAANDVTDSAGNTYALDISRVADFPGKYHSGIWRATASTTATISITLNPVNAGNIWASMNALSFRGMLTSPRDKFTTNNAVSTSASTGSTATLSQADEFVVAGLVIATLGTGTPTSPATTGYTSLFTQSDSTVGMAGSGDYKIVSATTAVSAAWTLSPINEYSGIICTYKYTTNPAPTLSVQPSATYASLTRTGPSNTWGVTFTASDAVDTGVDALTYEIRTAPLGGGTLVSSGTCTSGVSKVITGLAYNASGLVNGSNTLYVRVGDGTLSTDSNSFTLLRDDNAPSAATSISTTPSPVV